MFSLILLTDDHPVQEAALVPLTDLEKDTLLYWHIDITAGHLFVQASPRSHSKTCPAAAA